MLSDTQQFFRDIISAGAIIAGFCATFFAFRLQREANYFRQPNLNWKNKNDTKDIYIGLTNFSYSFKLIILATISAFLCGVLVPLFGIAGVECLLISPQFAVSGLVLTLFLLAGYFLIELVHYEIIWKKWRLEASEDQREKPIMLAILLVAVIATAATYWLLHQAV